MLKVPRVHAMSNSHAVQALIMPLQDFAFAEYENADSALRALRLLHNMDMGSGKLTLKCDTKTQSALQEHHRVKIQKVISCIFIHAASASISRAGRLLV